MSTFFETNRLFLREWSVNDIEPFAEINASPLVMEFFTASYSYQQTEDFVENIKAHFKKFGFGFYALELKESFELIGFCGLQKISVPIPYLINETKPVFEIKWRIRHSQWGKGYAPEAAKQVLYNAFHRHNLDKVMAFTSKLNQKSIRVMEKIGMHYVENEDFHLPLEAEDLQLHVLYQLTQYQKYG